MDRIEKLTRLFKNEIEQQRIDYSKLNKRYNDLKNGVIEVLDIMRSEAIDNIEDRPTYNGLRSMLKDLIKD